jgi:hypothetical protein
MWSIKILLLFIIVGFIAVIIALPESDPPTNSVITRGLNWDKKCEGKTCNLLISSAPLNYFNDSEFVPINRTIISSDDLLYDYEVERGIYEVYFKQDLTHAQSIKYVYNDSEFYFQPFTLNYRNALDQIQQINTIQSVNGTPVPYYWSEPIGTGHAEEHIYHDDLEIMNYENAFGYDTNLTYRYANKLLKLNLIVDPTLIPAPESYITSQVNVTIDIDFLISYSNDIDIYIEGELWDKQNTKRTENNVLFKKANETIFFLPKPVICEKPHWELNETTNITLWTSDCTNSEYVFKKQGNNLYVQLKSPYSFFNDTNNVYPMEIDPSIEISVSQSSDDAEETNAGGVILSDALLDLDALMYGGGIMFRDVNVAQAISISSATLKIKAISQCSGITDGCEQSVYGIDVDDASTFTTNNDDVSNKPKTSKWTYWGLDNDFVPNSAYQSFEINVTNSTQEILDRVGWNSGNNMGFIITADSYARGKALDIIAYDHASYPAPVLNITYTSTDTCTPPAINNNWEIDLSDDCNITESFDLGTGSLTFINTTSWNRVFFNVSANMSGLTFKDKLGAREDYEFGSASAFKVGT